MPMTFELPPDDGSCETNERSIQINRDDRDRRDERVFATNERLMHILGLNIRGAVSAKIEMYSDRLPVVTVRYIASIPSDSNKQLFELSRIEQ